MDDCDNAKLRDAVENKMIDSAEEYRRRFRAQILALGAKPKNNDDRYWYSRGRIDALSELYDLLGVPHADQYSKLAKKAR